MPVADYRCDDDADCNEPTGCESIVGAECYGGQCHYRPMVESLVCDDGSDCTDDDRCDGAGTCHGETIACTTPPNNFCTQNDSVLRDYASPGSCNPTTGVCEYEYEDTACASCSQECLHLPAAPEDLVATAGDAEVTLTWTTVEGALSHNLYVSQTPDDTDAVPVTGVSTPYVHTGLTNGTTYHFTVAAVADDGVGDRSVEVATTPRISAPGSMSAVGGDHDVTLTWNPVPGADTYNVYWTLQPGVSSSDSHVSSVTSPFVHTQCENGNSCYYAATAVDGTSESVLSEEVSATPRISAPAGLRAVGGRNEVTLTWDAVPGADTYNVYWSLDPGLTSGANQVDAVISPYVHTGLEGRTSYYYAVAAVDGPSESVLSQEMSALTLRDESKLVATDPQQWDNFGDAVALSGDHAIIGAIHESGGDGDPMPSAGAVYVFHRTSEDTWDTGTKLVAPDARERDNFGLSVALSGEYAIVGSPWEDGGEGDPLMSTGSAYVFHRTGENTWDAGPRLMAPDAQAFDRFGYSVALSGEYAIAGALYENGGAGDPLNGAGAAYVFHRSGNTWDTGTKLAAPDAESEDNFGTSVGVSGDYAIVGAPLEDGGEGDPRSAAGAAYVFHRSGSTWDTGTKLIASDAQADDQFGAAVAVSGDYAIVGALQEDGGQGDPVTNAGAAYVFHRTGENVWDAGTKLVAPGAQTGDRFATSVALSGDYAIVGVPFMDDNANNSTGAVYVFHRTGENTWNPEPKLLARDGQSLDSFGTSVAVSADTIIVGAGNKGDGDLRSAGAAYVFE